MSEDTFDSASEHKEIGNNLRILKCMKDQWLAGIKGKQMIKQKL